MLTRKRSYDLEEQSTRKRTQKRCYDLIPACSSKMQSLSWTFLPLLANVCNGTDNSMGLPHDEEFWTKFAEKLSCLQKKKFSAGSCEFFAKRFQIFYNALEDPGIIRPESMEAFSELTKSSDAQKFKPLLEDIFGRHPKLFSMGPSSVPETPQASNSSLRKVKANAASSKKILTWQSRGSSLHPELEMGVQEALNDLVSHNMLDLIDVVGAESFLSTSTWASSIFLQEEDREKRSAMIVNARKKAKEEKRRKY